MDILLLSQFLPADLLLHFEIVALKELGDLLTRKDCIYIYLDEKTPYRLALIPVIICPKNSLKEQKFKIFHYAETQFTCV